MSHTDEKPNNAKTEGQQLDLQTAYRVLLRSYVRRRLIRQTPPQAR